MEQKYVKIQELLPIIKEKLENNGEVTFTPFGHSMLPLFRDGKDSVILSKLNRKLKKNDLPLYQRNDGQIVLHRVIKICKNGDFVARGDNQIIKEKNIKQQQVIAIVKRFKRKQKEYTINMKRYTLYCGVWNFIFPLRWLIRKTHRLFSKMFKS